MPDVIRLLPDSVANQIAAGEVIQRPASVVKELAENAIDAGSSQLRLLVRDGGKTLIQVIDNGCGMSETDARLSFERHATSKIRDAGDLFAIRTLGFRGEALASIASIAQVVMRTRKPDQELGTEIGINGSVVEGQIPVQCPVGTNLSVKNLFYNTPARRKFLKSNPAEFRHIIAEFQRIALAHPEVELLLEHNDEEIYNLPATNLKQRIVHLFGKAINQNLTTIDTQTSLVSVSGYIGKPEFARRTAGEQFFFANNRYMRHPYFHKAIMSAYEKILPPDTIPSYFIFLDVDPESVDINIHPTKTEIKFENELAIFQILIAATREALGRFNLVPSIDFNGEPAIEIPHIHSGIPVKPPQISYNPHYNPFDSEALRIPAQKADMNLPHWEKLFKHNEMEGNELPANPELPLVPGRTEQAAPQQTFFQLKNKYILTPVKSGLMMIDQRRAHERILFEKYIRSLAMNFPPAQKTLFPVTVLLQPADYSTLSEIIPDLQKLGFDIGDLGNDTVVVNGYPEDTEGIAPEELIEAFLERFRLTETDIKTSVSERIASSMATAGSIRYGQPLQPEMMHQLVDALFACEVPGYSPSGKPVVVILEMDEIEKRFAKGTKG